MAFYLNEKYFMDPGWGPVNPRPPTTVNLQATSAIKRQARGRAGGRARARGRVRARALG